MIRLIQEFGFHTGRQLSFDQDRVRIGRAPDNDVSFDPNIDLDSSAKHCEIVREGGAYWIVDVGSRNGTLVNGARIQRHRLGANDLIECGRGGPRLRVDLPGQAGVATVGAVGRAPGAGGTVVAPQLAVPGASPGGAPGGAPGRVPGAAPGGAGGASVGQAFAANLPPGAQVGKRTVALMIDAALVQAGLKKSSHTGLKVFVGFLTLVVLGGLAAGGYYIWEERQDRHADGGVAAWSGSQIVAANQGNIYLLAIAREGRPDHGFCTAFAVTRDLVATNAHCVKRAQTEIASGGRIVALRNKSPGTRIPIVAYYFDPRFERREQSTGGSGYDVGLMRTGTALGGWVGLATDEEVQGLVEGDPIYVYGWPGSTMNEASPVATITLGLLNRTTDFFNQNATPARSQKIQHSAQTAGGSSGSPLFSSRTGRVVGMNAGALPDDERQVVYDPVSRTRREVEVNRSSSNFKYGMRADLIREAIRTVGEVVP